MNISINSKAVRGLVAASALGIAFAGGFAGGRTVDATRSDVSAIQRHSQTAVDSRQAAVDAERAALVTAQERVLAGIVAPERDLYLVDDSDAGRMTAAEAVLVATSGR